MKRWTRYGDNVFCGGPCALRILAGQPVLELHLAGGVVKRRCASCARHHGETAPADLPAAEAPAVPQHAPIPKTRHPFSGVSDLAQDWKQKRLGEDA